MSSGRLELPELPELLSVVDRRAWERPGGGCLVRFIAGRGSWIDSGQFLVS